MSMVAVVAVLVVSGHAGGDGGDGDVAPLVMVSGLGGDCGGGDGGHGAGNGGGGDERSRLLLAEAAGVAAHGGSDGGNGGGDQAAAPPAVARAKRCDMMFFCLLRAAASTPAAKPVEKHPSRSPPASRWQRLAICGTDDNWGGVTGAAAALATEPPIANASTWAPFPPTSMAPPLLRTATGPLPRQKALQPTATMPSCLP